MQRGSITIHHDGSWSLLIHGECDEDIIEAVRELINTNQYAIEQTTQPADR